MFAEFGWPNLVYIVDGTLFPLVTKPETEDAADYLGRKLGYTINAMILCDDKRRVRAYLAGNPGTYHDERAFKQMDIALNPGGYLAGQQYGIGDSAFDPRPFMIPAYKKPVANLIPREHKI